MRNLEDHNIATKVRKIATMARVLGVAVSKTTEAAVHAYMEAATHPGSLVRITVDKNDEMAVFDALAGGDRNRRNIDWTKTALRGWLDEDPESLLTIEFKNGSAIEMRTKNRA